VIASGRVAQADGSAWLNYQTPAPMIPEPEPYNAAPEAANAHYLGPGQGGVYDRAGPAFLREGTREPDALLCSDQPMEPHCN